MGQGVAGPGNTGRDGPRVRLRQRKDPFLFGCRSVFADIGGDGDGLGWGHPDATLPGIGARDDPLEFLAFGERQHGVHGGIFHLGHEAVGGLARPLLRQSAPGRLLGDGRRPIPQGLSSEKRRDPLQDGVRRRAEGGIRKEKHRDDDQQQQQHGDRQGQ